MLTGILLTVAGLAGLTYGAVSGTRAAKRENAQNALENYVKQDEALKNLNVTNLISRAADMGYITRSDKTRYLNLLKDFDSDHGPFEALTDFSGKNTEEIARLYGVLTKVAPEISDVLNNYAGVDVKQSLMSNIPALSQVPSPGYMNADFEGYQRDVEPVKWWTGKELAEHHDLDYDVDSMYNAIKQGTSANVDNARYQSRYANEASLKDNEILRSQYLQNLRNTKSDAITSGATAGARDAAELLSNVNTSNNFASNQKDVVEDRYNLINDYLLKDAQAAITANEAYQTLGKDIASNIEYLYNNDVNRYVGDMNANAQFFAADQALRNSINEANASMYSNYVANQAVVNREQAGINAAYNQYAWMWDRFHGRALESGYTGNEANAIANNDFFNWVLKDATGADNYVQLRNAANK